MKRFLHTLVLLFCVLLSATNHSFASETESECEEQLKPPELIFYAFRLKVKPDVVLTQRHIFSPLTQANKTQGTPGNVSDRSIVWNQRVEDKLPKHGILAASPFFSQSLLLPFKNPAIRDQEQKIEIVFEMNGPELADNQKLGTVKDIDLRPTTHHYLLKGVKKEDIKNIYLVAHYRQRGDIVYRIENVEAFLTEATQRFNGYKNKNSFFASLVSKRVLAVDEEKTNQNAAQDIIFSSLHKINLASKFATISSENKVPKGRAKRVSTTIYEELVSIHSMLDIYKRQFSEQQYLEFCAEVRLRLVLALNPSDENRSYYHILRTLLEQHQLPENTQ